MLTYWHTLSLPVALPMLKSGGSLYGGQRYGFIRFGSRVDVYLPAGSRVRVAIGDKVQATSTVLAELPDGIEGPSGGIDGQPGHIGERPAVADEPLDSTDKQSS